MEKSRPDFCEKSVIKIEYASSMETNETHHMTPCKTYHTQRALLSPLQTPFDRMSPRNFSTPKKYSTLGKISEVETSGQERASQSYSYKFLPKFTTPPTRPVKEFVAKNPFDMELQSKLHLPIFSPSVFKRCVSPSKECQDAFLWTIDDMSRIHPAPIEDNIPDHLDSVFSPETESRTQQAIESYFCTTQVLQSPWTAPQSGAKKGSVLSMNGCNVDRAFDTPSRQQDVYADSETDAAPTRSSWTQTTLSLPPVLPDDVEAALLPYFTFHQDQKQHYPEVGELDESGLNTSSSLLRRKLFHRSPDKENDDVERDDSVISCAQHATPARGTHLFSNVMRVEQSVALRNYGTPLPGAQHYRRSPSISPIECEIESLPTLPGNKQRGSSSASPVAVAPALTLSRNRSSVSARLDFSDESMAIDRSLTASTPEEVNDPFNLAATSTPFRVASPTNRQPTFSFSTNSIYSCTNPTQHDTGYNTESGYNLETVCNAKTGYSAEPGFNAKTDFKAETGYNIESGYSAETGHLENGFADVSYCMKNNYATSNSVEDTVDQITLWQPHSKHITSSTPTK